jgi:ABC-type Mn2+/Zn2+ transport system ATPase subunit
MDLAESVPLITLENAAIGYRRPGFFTDVNFSLKRGDFLGIVGPNGAGKSTVMRTLLGTLPVLAGRRDDLPSGRRSRIGYVPQRDESDPLLPLSAFEVVCMGTFHGLGLLRVPGRKQHEQTGKALKAVGIAHLAHKPYRSLSGGQKQRTLIARALAAQPEILLLDEPTNGMDIVSQKAMLDLLGRLHREFGLTLVIISHLLTEVASAVNQLLLVDKDRGLFHHGPTDEVLDRDLLSRIYGVGLHLHRDAGRITISVDPSAD